MKIKYCAFLVVFFVGLTGCASPNSARVTKSDVGEENINSPRAYELRFCEPVIRIAAKYPESAYVDGREEDVILRFKINERMFAESITAIDSVTDSEFKVEAINALRKWMFKREDIGKPCKVVIKFTLNNVAQTNRL